MLTRTVAGRTFDYSHAVGGRYIGQPCSLAVGSGNTVYVLLRGGENISNVAWNRTGTGARVARLSIPETAGDEDFIGEAGSYGDGDGEYIWPTGLALDSQENVYVTDEWMNRITVTDREGKFICSWGATGTGNGEFDGPAGIAVDADDNLYIVDSRNHRVQKTTKDGKFLGKWGSLGSSSGEFDSPWGICLDGEGNVYVADHKNDRVQKFTSNGEYCASFGSSGTGRGEVTRPTDVAVDSDGDVYICDWANDRVQAYTPDGEFITTFIGDAQQLALWHQMTVDANTDVIKARRRVTTLEPEWRLAMPRAVAFDEEKSRLMVADTQRGRIQIYNKLKDYLEPQFNL